MGVLIIRWHPVPRGEAVERWQQQSEARTAAQLRLRALLDREHMHRTGD